MRIFLTGGTGYIGSAVIEAFVRAGHHIDALVRNSESAAQVQTHGAHPIFGDLAQPATYADAAAAADGVVHAAYEHTARGSQVDLTAIDTLLTRTDTGGRFVIYTSGIWVLGPGAAPLDETAPVNPAQLVAWRPSHEQRVLDAATAGIRTIVVRPGIVYGGSRGIVGDLFRDGANGLIRVIGSGDNHWPLVYDRDLGDLYLRLATNREASGIFHANDEGDESVNDVVAAIVGHMSIRPSVRHMPILEARQKMGAYADALVLDQKVRSPRARALGWVPSLRSISSSAPRLFEEWRGGRQAAYSVSGEAQ